MSDTMLYAILILFGIFHIFEWVRSVFRSLNLEYLATREHVSRLRTDVNKLLVILDEKFDTALGRRQSWNQQKLEAICAYFNIRVVYNRDDYVRPNRYKIEELDARYEKDCCVKGCPEEIEDKSEDK